MQPRLLALMDPPHATRGGDFHYRAFSPARALSELDGVHVVQCDRLHREAFRLARAADVLVLNSVCDADLFPLIAERDARGLPTVFEVSDDFTAIPEANPIHAFYRVPANQRLYQQLVHASTAAQFTVPELERLFGHLTKQGRVFENQLLDVPAPPAPRDPARLVVGWGGSSGHRDDMAHVAQALIEWVLRTPHATLRIMGADSIWALFEALPESRKERVPTGDLAAYYRFCASLDIGLAPLLDTGFNRSRSDVKLVEYAAHGAVPVVQDLEPYRRTARDGENARLFRTHEELVRVLDELARSPEERTRIAATAYAWVASTRSERGHAEGRLAFYASLTRGAASREPDVEAVLGSVRRLEGAETSGRHTLLGHGEVETWLHDALVLGQGGRADEARALLAKAADEAPRHDLPPLYAGGLFGDEAALLRALDRNPRSVSAVVALGKLAFGRGDPKRALGLFIRAADLAPAYDVPFELAATAAARLGAVGDAQALEAHAAALARKTLRP